MLLGLLPLWSLYTLDSWHALWEESWRINWPAPLLRVELGLGLGLLDYLGFSQSLILGLGLSLLCPFEKHLQVDLS